LCFVSPKIIKVKHNFAKLFQNMKGDIFGASHCTIDLHVYINDNEQEED